MNLLSYLCSLLFSLRLCLLSLSLSVSVSLRVVLLCFLVLCQVVLCSDLSCGAVRCVVWCVSVQNVPCVRPKRPRVYRHHARMFRHMCAWCQHTRERFGRTHGGTGWEGAVVSHVFSPIKQVFLSFIEHINRTLGSSLIANFLLTMNGPRRVIT